MSGVGRSRGRLGAMGLLALAACAAGCGASSTPAKNAPARPAAALRVSGDRVNVKPLLDADAALARAAGAGPLQVLGGDIAAEGERVGAFVEIPDDQCMLALARGSNGIGDIDLFSYDDDGDTLVTDESPDADASILVCPPHPKRVYVVARVMAGGGIVAVGVQSVPKKSEAAVATAVGARAHRGEQVARLESWPGLEERIRAHRVAIGSRWEDVRRAAVPVDPRAPTLLSVSVQPGRCLDVLALPSEEVSSLDVVAEDVAGRIVARSRELGRDRTLLLCSSTAADVVLSLRPRASQGLVAVVIGRSAVGAEAELGGTTPIDRVSETRELADARASRARELSSSGYASAKSVATGKAVVGERVSVPLELPAGCARVDVVAGKPLANVGADLWDDKGDRLAQAAGGTGAVLFTCGPARAARVDVEALARPGPFAVEVRRDPAAPPVLVAHPIAAARLLERLNAGGGPALGANAAARAELVPLDAQMLKAMPVAIPSGGCVDVVAALDGGGEGVDMRLVDAAGGSSLTRSRYVASDRLCAGDTAGNGSVELRLAAGKAEALVLVRPVAGSAR